MACLPSNERTVATLACTAVECWVALVAPAWRCCTCVMPFMPLRIRVASFPSVLQNWAPNVWQDKALLPPFYYLHRQAARNFVQRGHAKLGQISHVSLLIEAATGAALEGPW